ncbi:MAG: DUF481 domain-containing protein [Gemmatimonadaceae bacterium]|nr:DUF481 domain-containing protein [Gemmatimonadaceae bacterium]
MPSFLELRQAGASALAFVLLSTVPVAPAVALTPTPKPSAKLPKLWSGGALANASIFFGNTQQQVLGADGRLARVDSALGVSAELQTQYGEASVQSGPRTVIKRLWLGTVAMTFRPLAPFSSFVTTTFESNLEKRIASRYSLGAGAKWNIQQTPASAASLSLSLSAEQTTPLDSSVHFPDERIARFSWLAKYHHAFDDRVQITHATSWQPSATGVSQFLVSSSTELREKMNGTVSLSLAFTDNYDSGALARGAHSYNDGQMLFGIAAGW